MKTDLTRLRKMAEMLQTGEYRLPELAVALQMQRESLKIYLLNLRYIQSLSRVCQRKIHGIEYWTTEEDNDSIPEELKDVKLKMKELFEKIKQLEEENDEHKDIPNDDRTEGRESVEAGTEQGQHGVQHTPEQGQPSVPE